MARVKLAELAGTTRKWRGERHLVTVPNGELQTAGYGISASVHTKENAMYIMSRLLNNNVKCEKGLFIFVLLKNKT